MGLIEGKTAIVTGSGRGIGKAIAQILAREGANVVVNDIDGDIGQKAVQEITAYGGRSVLAVASVDQTDGAETIIKAAVDSFGRLDILVNNAGVTRDSMYHKITDDNWDLVVNTHLKGTFNCMRAASPYMRDVAKVEAAEGQKSPHRKIVNTTSIAYHVGAVGQANYAAAKGGIIGLSRTASSELAKFNINVNVICPGFTNTRMTREQKEGEKTGIPKKMRDRLIEGIPLRRAGEPEDIAQAVLFLVSPMSDFITGQTLCVNGGEYKL